MSESTFFLLTLANESVSYIFCTISHIEEHARGCFFYYPQHSVGFLYILYFSTQFAAKIVFAFSCDAINSFKGNMKIRSVINKQLNMNTK